MPSETQTSIYVPNTTTQQQLLKSKVKFKVSGTAIVYASLKNKVNLAPGESDSSPRQVIKDKKTFISPRPTCHPVDGEEESFVLFSVSHNVLKTCFPINYFSEVWILAAVKSQQEKKKIRLVKKILLRDLLGRAHHPVPRSLPRAQLGAAVEIQPLTSAYCATELASTAYTLLAPACTAKNDSIPDPQPTSRTTWKKKQRQERGENTRRYPGPMPTLSLAIRPN